MRRRLAFLSTFIALLMVLVLPATTVASSKFTYSVQKNTCSASGGMHGYGHLYFQVKQSEWGNSGANKLTFTATLQHKILGTKKWRTEHKYGTHASSFPSNGANHSYSRWYSWDPNDFSWHRIKVVLKAWNGGWLLAKKVLYGKTC